MVFTIINLFIAPTISKKVGYDNDQRAFWGTLNCAKLKDQYDDIKDETIMSAQYKKSFEVRINKCDRTKAMYNMEYSSFILNIIFSFVCGLLAFLHLFDVKRDFIIHTGIIGLCCGIVGFVLTFVYLVYNGLVFTNNYSSQVKTNSNGAFAERIGETNDYNCIYFAESGNVLSVYAKFNELNKKQYNYNKDLHQSYQTNEYSNCKGIYDNSYNNLIEICAYEETVIVNRNYLDGNGDYQPCKYLYNNEQNEIYNRDIFNRFATTLFFSLIICLANIGLALFGYLSFSKPSEF